MSKKRRKHCPPDCSCREPVTLVVPALPTTEYRFCWHVVGECDNCRGRSVRPWPYTITWPTVISTGSTSWEMPKDWTLVG